MVNNKGEFPTEEVIPELQDCPLDGQRFLLDCGIATHCRGQLSTHVDHRCSSPSTTCERTAPSPVSDASVCKRKGQPKSGARRRGSEVSAAFTCWNARSASRLQGVFSGCPFRVRSVRGAAKEEKLGIKQR